MLHATCRTIALLASVLPALAAPSDPVLARLDRARRSYERAADTARRALEDGVEDACRALRGGDDPVDSALRGNALRDDYRLRGILPEELRADRAYAAYLDARADLEKAYAGALEAFHRRGEEAALACLTAEVERLTVENDLVPWRDLTLADDAAAPRAVGLEPVECAAPAGGGPYRLQLEGVLDDPAGALLVTLPACGGGAHEVEVPADEDGAFQVLLSVRPEGVACELGLPRPVAATRIAAAGPVRLTLHARGAEAKLAAVRAKPVVVGRLPEADVRTSARTADRGRDDEPEEVPFAYGRRWSGTWGGNGCDVEVVEVNGDWVALRIRRANGAVFRLEGTVHDGRFRLDVVKHIVSVAPDQMKRFFVSQQGSAYVRNGRLYVSCRTRNDFAGKRNESFPIDIDGAEPR